jgi:TRAP-type transport system periplasmic protein
MATPYAENFHTLNIRAFIQDVEQATGGRLSVQLHNNASLLPMAQIKRGVQTGQVQLGEILLSAYANEDPFFEVDGVPFLAWTWPQAEALQAATEPYIRARLERQGLVPLYMVHWDAQGFYTRGELRSVQELRGTRFRAYNNVTARMAELMGATPVTVQAAEVSQAFATNVIQSMFTSAQTGVSVSAWDYTRYWTNVGGMRTRNVVFANARAFAALDEPTRAAVLQAADRAAARGKEMAKEAEVRMAERLRERGVQTPPPGEALMAELRAIGETLTLEWAQRAGPEGQQMLERYRAALR